MRREIQNYLATRHDLRLFIRENPVWYRILCRNPEKLFEIEQEAKIFYGKTFPQKIDRLQQQIQLANLLVGMVSAMEKNR
ncbi:YlbE-like family protein [Schinkia sp. CFF1]